MRIAIPVLAARHDRKMRTVVVAHEFIGPGFARGREVVDVGQVVEGHDKPTHIPAHADNRVMLQPRVKALSVSGQGRGGIACGSSQFRAGFLGDWRVGCRVRFGGFRLFVWRDAEGRFQCGLAKLVRSRRFRRAESCLCRGDTRKGHEHVGFLGDGIRPWRKFRCRNVCRGNRRFQDRRPAIACDTSKSGPGQAAVRQRHGLAVPVDPGDGTAGSWCAKRHFDRARGEQAQTHHAAQARVMRGSVRHIVPRCLNGH